MSKRRSPTTRPVFTELEPEIIPAVEPEATSGPWFASSQPNQEPTSSYAHLPLHGDGALEASVIGPRLRLIPRDRVAAARLGAMEAQAGRYYDKLTRNYISRFGEQLRRGTARIDSLRAFGALAGAPITLSPAAEAAARRYQRNLRLQLAPIPRVIWRDERADADDERVVAEIDLAARRRDPAIPDHRIN